MVADRMASLHVGSVTQDIEEEIVATLEQLLEALKTMQQENEQQLGGASAEGESQPLLPPSAELKLLRCSQVRVNARTTAIEQARLEGAESQETLRRLLETVADRQARCAEIAREMHERQSQP